MPAEKSLSTSKAKGKAGTVLARSAHVPGKTRKVDAAKFKAVRTALLKAVPRKAPGYSDAEMTKAVRRLVPSGVFPDKGKLAWWMKRVQEDLEARKILAREKSKPIRWHRTR